MYTIAWEERLLQEGGFFCPVPPLANQIFYILVSARSANEIFYVSAELNVVSVTDWYNPGTVLCELLTDSTQGCNCQ